MSFFVRLPAIPDVLQRHSALALIRRARAGRTLVCANHRRDLLRAAASVVLASTTTNVPRRALSSGAYVGARLVIVTSATSLEAYTIDARDAERHVLRIPASSCFRAATDASRPLLQTPFGLMLFQSSSQSHPHCPGMRVERSHVCRNGHVSGGGFLLNGGDSTGASEQPALHNTRPAKPNQTNAQARGVV